MESFKNTFILQSLTEKFWLNWLEMRLDGCSKKDNLIFVVVMRDIYIIEIVINIIGQN